MKFLKRLWTTLIDYLPYDSSLPNNVNDQELLARYLTSKKWFSSLHNRVKPHAFMPPSHLELSVFRIANLPVPTIWKIGRRAIRKMKEPKTLYGSGDILAVNVLDLLLLIQPDNKPPRHANIVGWPVDKEEQKSIAQELAARASLRLNSA